MKTLHDRAAQFKWEYEPNTNSIPGGWVKFPNGFLSQKQGSPLSGGFYTLEIPVLDVLSGPELKAVKVLRMSVRLHDASGTFQARFEIVSEDEVLFSGIRKMLEWREPQQTRVLPAFTVSEKPTYQPMRPGEKPQDYCKRTGMSMQEYLNVIDQIPVGG